MRIGLEQLTLTNWVPGTKMALKASYVAFLHEITPATMVNETYHLYTRLSVLSWVILPLTILRSVLKPYLPPSPKNAEPPLVPCCSRGRLCRTEQHPGRLAAAQRSLRCSPAIAAEDATAGNGDAATDDGQIVEGPRNHGFRD